jgi:hypothetical protein
VSLRVAITTLTGVLLVTIIDSRASVYDISPGHRFQLAVEVDTPEKLSSGASVIEAKQALVRAGSGPVNQDVERRVRGQAVAVDLSGKKQLLILLRSQSDVGWENYVYEKFGPRSKGKPFAKQLNNVVKLTKETFA